LRWIFAVVVFVVVMTYLRINWEVGLTSPVVDWQLEAQELHLQPFNRGFATEAGPGGLEGIGSLVRRETLLMGYRQV